VPLDENAEFEFMSSELARVTTYKWDVVIYYVQGTHIYTIHKFLVKVRYNGLKQFCLGRLEYVKSVVISLFAFHLTYLRVSWVVFRMGDAGSKPVTIIHVLR